MIPNLAHPKAFIMRVMTQYFPPVAVLGVRSKLISKTKEHLSYVVERSCQMFTFPCTNAE